MTINEKLIEILVCPENRTSVSYADSELTSKVNALISAGRISNRGGANVLLPIEGGLVRADRKYLYPIREDIPIMLINEAIPLEQLNN